jgi:vWA-MoxR associated protein C-terminal domain/TIR domain
LSVKVISPLPDIGIYSVAFSFAGEQRDVVRKLVAEVQRLLLPGDVFFDENFDSRIAGSDTWKKLRDLYRSKATLVVRCLSPDYARKEWCQVERGAAEDRLPSTILDVKVAEGNPDGWSGLTGHYLDGYSDANRRHTAKTIVDRMTDALSISGNPRTQVSTLAARQLIRLLDPIPVPQVDISGSIPETIRPQLGLWHPDQHRVGWWINALRNHDPRQLISFLHGIWPSIKQARAGVESWFIEHLPRAGFAVPTARSKVKALQVMIAPLTPGPDQNRYELSFHHAADGQTSRLVNLGEVARDKLKLCFEQEANAHLRANVRVEFILDREFLHGDAVDWEIEVAVDRVPVGASYPTVVRSFERGCGRRGYEHSQRASETWKHFTAAKHGMYVPGASAAHRLGWRDLHTLILPHLSNCQTQESRIADEIILTGVPVACWSRGGLQPSDLDRNELIRMLDDLPGLPNAFLQYRLSRALTDSIPVLLYEDADVPIPDLSLERSQLSQESLEPNS